MTFWDVSRIARVGNSYFPVLLRLIEESYNYYYKANLSYFSKTEMSKTLITSYSYINRIFPIVIEAGFIVPVTVTGTKYIYYIFNKDKKEDVEVMIKIMKESKEAYVKIMEAIDKDDWEPKKYPLNLVREFGVKSLRTRGV